MFNLYILTAKLFSPIACNFILPLYLYSRICLSRHLKGNRKSGDLGKQQINMLRPTQTLDPFVSAEAEHLRNKEHKQKGLFGLLYNNIIFI